MGAELVSTPSENKEGPNRKKPGTYLTVSDSCSLENRLETQSLLAQKVVDSPPPKVLEENVHPVIKQLKLSTRETESPVKAGRIKEFATNWQRFTRDPYIISTVKGHQIEFSSVPKQYCLPRQPNFTENDCALIDKEITDMLSKQAIEP